MFHELAEAYAKLELGLDYLEHGSEPGAHALALDRERRLKAQRPASHIVMTAGSNRVLRTREEIRLFYAEGANGVQPALVPDLTKDRRSASPLHPCSACDNFWSSMRTKIHLVEEKELQWLWLRKLRSR